MNYEKLDTVLGKVARYAVIALVVYLLWVIIQDSIVGRFMLYEDYYNQRGIFEKR